MKRILTALMFMAGTCYGQIPDSTMQWLRQAASLPRESAAVVDVGSPVSWWKITTSDTTNLSDQVGSINGTYGAAISLITTNGAYLQTTNSTTSFVNFGDVTLLDNTTNKVTVSMWIFDKTPTAPAYHRYLDKETSAGVGWSFMSRNNLGTPCIELARAGGFLTVRTSASIATSSWTHVVFTYSGNDDSSGVAIYVDSVSRALTAENNTLAAGSIDNASNCLLVIDTGYSQTAGLIGYIDDVRWFNTVLTATQITNLYTQGRQ